MAVRKKQTPKPAGMSGAKFTKTQQEEVRATVAQMDRRGYSQYAIAEKLDLSQPTISYYLSEIREEYRTRQRKSVDELLHEKLEQYKEIRLVAWEAYDLSQKDKEKEEVETAPVVILASTGKDKKGLDPADAFESAERIKRIVTREGRLPADGYLTIIMKTLEAERKLLGIDEELPPQNSNNLTVINWDTLHQRPPQRDPLKEKLKELDDRSNQVPEAQIITSQSIPEPVQAQQQDAELTDEELEKRIMELEEQLKSRK